VVAVRRFLAVAIFVALVSAPCLSVCAGWSASAHARMACCADKAQNDADACCASGESRQGPHPFGALTAALPAPALVSFASAAVVAIPSPMLFDIATHTVLASDSDRYARLSVFLI
jgi:hypothetical protein